MSYPLNVDARGLASLVIIRDLQGVEVARCEMEEVAEVPATPQQDFIQTGLDINMGVNSNHGQVNLYIDDRNRNFIETINGNVFSVFKAGFTVEVFLGKDFASLNLWVFAVLQDIDLSYQTNIFDQHLQCFGYGIRTSQRLSVMKRTQGREDDGITPKPSDTSTFISNLFKDTLEKTDHLASPGLGQLDITTENVQDLSIAIPEFQKNLVSFGSILTELAAMGYAYYGVDQNKKAFLFRRGEVSSGFLISNDVTNSGVETVNWNPDKIMIFRDKPIIIHDTSSDSAYSILHFVGAQRLFVDFDNQTADADLDTSVKTTAFEFEPEFDNVAELSIGLHNTSGATIDKDLRIAIVGDDGTGSPNINNIRKSIILNAELLNEKVTLDGILFTVKFDKIPVTHGEKLFVIIFKNENPTDALGISYLDDIGSYFESSDDGATWTTSQDGLGLLITLSSKNVRIIGEDTVASRNLLPKEGIVNMPDTPNQETILLIAQSMLLAKSRILRNYEPVTVSAPTLPPELGKCIRLIDTVLNIDTEVDLIGYSLSINSLDESNRGATSITVMFQEQYSQT